MVVNASLKIKLSLRGPGGKAGMFEIPPSSGLGGSLHEAYSQYETVNLNLDIDQLFMCSIYISDNCRRLAQAERNSKWLLINSTEGIQASITRLLREVQMLRIS